MCMFDMLVNAVQLPEMSVKDFCARQQLLYRYDLTAGPASEELDFKRIYIEQRLEFLGAFLDFCRSSPGPAEQRWVNWLSFHKVNAGDF